MGNGDFFLHTTFGAVSIHAIPGGNNMSIPTVGQLNYSDDRNISAFIFIGRRSN